MKFKTYWNAYLIAGYQYRLYRDCGLDYKKRLRQYYKFLAVVTAAIQSLDDYERQGEIDGGSDV